MPYRLFKLLRGVGLSAFLLLLWGCSSYSEQTRALVSKTSALSAVDFPLSFSDQEMMLEQINQLLMDKRISPQEQADFYFERGVLYDSLGRWGLAFADFNQAVRLKPKEAASYNYLGLYLLLNKEYEKALDAFNLALEIDPHYDYALFNRGLSFYYVDRLNLAQKDLMKFYQRDKKDPYRILWLYFNELKLQPQQAKKNLELRAKQLSYDSWGTYLIDYLIGRLSVDTLVQKAQQFISKTSTHSAELLTETYFYLAKQQLTLGQVEDAKLLFRLAIENQVYNFVEYRFALFELAR